METQEEKLERRERFFANGVRRSLRFNVRSRYSAGSPAQVPEHIALQVVRDEQESYRHALEGAYGEEQKKRAETLGLSGIVYVMFEKGSGRQFRWHIWDLLTDEHTSRHHDHEIHRLGYYRFEHLPEGVQKRIVQPGCRYPDYDRRFYKVSPMGEIEEYKPEIVRV